MGSNFSILITTFNRLKELKYTLNSLEVLINVGAKIIICDDASTDGTSIFLKQEYPEIELLKNADNKGLIYSRNLLMNHVKTPYAISLDDDANFLSSNVLEEISSYFEKNNKCGIISFRVYWGKTKPIIVHSDELACRVKSFLGGAHVWRMQAWNEIPDYPGWYLFYGEETFAALQLFKKGWGVYYLPSVLVHHRVDNKARKGDKDYYVRARRSFRADLYNFMIFYPKRRLLKLFLYSLKSQIFKAKKTNDMKFAKNLLLAMGDVFANSGKLKKNRKSLTFSQYEEWKKLPDAKIYWKPQSAQFK